VSVAEVNPAGDMVATRVGTLVYAGYTPGCGALEHVVYRGTGPIASGVVWNAAYCALGVNGLLNFDPGTPPSGSFFYFVVVGQQVTDEGSYGKNHAGVQRPEAIGIGACDLPLNLAGSCP
jgi:hypothetical protein